VLLENPAKLAIKMSTGKQIHGLRISLPVLSFLEHAFDPATGSFETFSL